MTHSFKISDSLFLVQQTVSQAAPTVVTDIPTNHIAIIDCSGSMYGDLPRLREQLKKKLPKLLKEKDTLSLIWFSGWGQFGTLLEAEPVATLADLKAVEQAIDRWLKPMGLTGFKEPLEEASKVVDRISQKSSSSIFSLAFMSDGCDNQWGRADILKAVETVGGKVASATFVEYGYYADRQLLAAMAEKAGGAVIFAESFDNFMPNFEAILQKRSTGAPKIEVPIAGDPICGFAFSLADGDLLTFGVEGGSIKAPKDIGVVYYLSPTADGKAEDIKVAWNDTLNGPSTPPHRSTPTA